MFFTFIMLVIIASSVWVLVDAQKQKVPMNRKRPYSPSNGSVAWFIGCLLLWIIGFPWYLVARSAVLAERRSSVPPLASSLSAKVGPHCVTCGALLAPAAGFCHVCGSPVHRANVDAPAPGGDA